MLKEGIIKAYEYAQEKHVGKMRKFSDLPYFSHPKAVARIIEELTANEQLVIVALLHDVVEDTDTTVEEIKELFGVKIASLVKELTSRELKHDESKTTYLCDKMIKMTSDALTVKLADRFHNIKYLEGDKVHLSFIKKYYKETRSIIDFIKLEIEFNKTQDILVKRIEAILDFLQVRYEF